jgi:hypothetical protein
MCRFVYPNRWRFPQIVPNTQGTQVGSSSSTGHFLGREGPSCRNFRGTQELRKKWLLDRLLTYELYVGCPSGCEHWRSYHQEIAISMMENVEEEDEDEDEDEDD